MTEDLTTKKRIIFVTTGIFAGIAIVGCFYYIFSKRKTLTGRKDSWCEVVGVNMDEAKQRIEQDRLDVTVIPQITNSPVIQDFRFDRVWLFYDQNTRKVTATPMIG